MSDKDERAARLAAQLRANLHRRKAQARAAAQPRDATDDAAVEGGNTVAAAPNPGDRRN